MKTADFDYFLPPELIAQTPLVDRTASRLMILDKNTGETDTGHFSDILQFINKGDCLILNNSKVMPARILGNKEGTGGAVEFLLIEQKEDGLWEVMVKPGKRLKIGARAVFGDGILTGEIVEILENHNRLVKFEHSMANIFEVLDRVGQMPLPHYITEKLEDKDRYQTVYAKDMGSCAAPTAGLHFTNELLDIIVKKGVNIDYVTLHVGIGTFRPVKVEDVTSHEMHSEHYYLPQSVADLVNSTKASGNSVFSVGTTSCRTLETVGTKFGSSIKEDSGYTNIFIYPGYDFKVVDKLITNFHLPESTLIMLVSALAGKEAVLNAYKKAVDDKFRFFSFGDAMLIK